LSLLVTEEVFQVLPCRNMYFCCSCCNTASLETQGFVGGSVWFQGRSHQCSFYFFLYSRV